MTSSERETQERTVYKSQERKTWTAALGDERGGRVPREPAGFKIDTPECSLWAISAFI